MRVLIIGGTNFIGPHVARLLDRLEHEVTLYHRGTHEAELPASVRHIHSHRASIPIFHFPSSLSDPPPEVVLHMFPVGEDDTRAAVARFVGVARRIVLISSGDVYLAYGRLLGTEPGPPSQHRSTKAHRSARYCSRIATWHRVPPSGCITTRKSWPSAPRSRDVCLQRC